MILGDAVILGSGGETASILAIGDVLETDTVYAEKGGKRINGVWDSTQNRFRISPIREYGTWTLTAKRTGRADIARNVLIDAAEEFTVEVNHRLYLYRQGDECTSITGGWIASDCVSDFNYGQGFRGKTPTLTKNMSVMVLSLNSDVMSVGEARTGKSVDVTDFTTINIHCNTVDISDGHEALAYISFVRNNQDIFTPDKEVTVINAWGGDWHKQDFTVTDWVNDLSGEFFIYVYVACSSGANITEEIDQIWLE